MPTKGASHRYGNTKGSKNKVNYQWAKKFNRGGINQHFEDHFKEFKCKTKEEYIAKAIKFANTIDRKNCRVVIDKFGTTYKYKLKTNELALITNDGYIISYRHFGEKFWYLNKDNKKIWIYDKRRIKDDILQKLTKKNKKNRRKIEVVEIKCPICDDYYFFPPGGDFYDDELEDYLNGNVSCYNCGWIYDYNQYLNPNLKKGFNDLNLKQYKKWYEKKLKENPKYCYFEENMPERIPHDCPLCGEYVFPNELSYDICLVCGWNDDGFDMEPHKKPNKWMMSFNEKLEYFKRQRKKNPNYRWDTDEPRQECYNDDEDEENEE